MRMRTTVGTLALCCFGLAVAGPAAGQIAGGPAVGAPAAPAAHQGATVKLLEAGGGSKKELRYALRKGTTETMAMDINMSMKMSAGGQQMNAMDLPTMRMTMKLETAEVMAGGDAKVNIEFADAEVVDKPGLPPQVAEQMRQSMQKTKGLKGTATISPRGQASDVKFDVPADADPQTRQSIEQAKQQMSQMGTALPAEAVGTGARWEVTMPVESNGLKMTQVATYTLKELAADGATVDVAIRQSAPKQPMPQAGGMQLEKMEGTGTGTTKVQFNKLVPAEATANIEMSMVMGAQGQGQMNMDMKVAVTMKPGEKK